MTQYISKKCKICNRPDRVDIEKDMQQMIQADVARKYSLTNQNVSNHYIHIEFNIGDRLEELIREALQRKLKPESIGDLARLLSEYRAYRESEQEDRCNNCPLKQESAVAKLRNWLSDDSAESIPEDAYIVSGIDGKKRTLNEHLGGISTMSEEEYQQYRKKYKIDGV